MIINFSGELDAVLGDVVIEQLLDIYIKNQAIIEANDRLKYKSDYLPLYCDEVEFRINSVGGDLFKFLNILDLIERMKEEQKVTFYGRVSSHAYSAGFYLLCACDYRTVSKFASLMYHEMSMLRQDKLSDLESETKRMNKIQNILDELVINNTKMTKELLESYRGRDLWMDYDDCVKYGIVKEEPSEEELRQQLLGEEKDVMTESQWNEFIEEMKQYVNIVPDEPVEETEQESTEEITEWKCGVATTCDSICCKFCDKFRDNIDCEDRCDVVSDDMTFDDCEFAKEYKESTDEIGKIEKGESIEYECIEPTDCEKYKGGHKCCKFCEDKSDCKLTICVDAFDKEECKYRK